MSSLICLFNVEQLIIITYPKTLGKEPFIGNSVESL